MAKGLTRSSDSMSGLEDDSDPDSQHESEVIKLARQDPRSTKLRENIFSATRAVVEMWPGDAAISLVRGVRLCACMSRADLNWPRYRR